MSARGAGRTFLRAVQAGEVHDGGPRKPVMRSSAEGQVSICSGNITSSSRHLHRRTKKIIAFLDGLAGLRAASMASIP
jgi:hypothetical protein